MLTRKSIDTVLLSVGAEKLSQREWSYPRNMDTGLSEVLVFKLFRTEAATPTVPPPPIVITFDIIKRNRLI